MLELWIPQFVTDRCVIGSYASNKIYQVNGMQLLAEFNSYLALKGVWEEMEQKEFYREMLRLYKNDTHKVSKKHSELGRKFIGITLTEILNPVGPIVVHAAIARQVEARAESRRKCKEKRDEQLLTHDPNASDAPIVPVSTRVRRINVVASVPTNGVPPPVPLANLSNRTQPPMQMANLSNGLNVVSNNTAYQNVAPIILPFPSLSPQGERVTVIGKSPFGSFVPPDPLTPESSPSPSVSYFSLPAPPKTVMKLRVNKPALPTPVPVTRSVLRVNRPQLPWDGRHLGKLADTNFSLLCEHARTKATHYCLSYQGTFTAVTKTRSKDSTPNIIDELKPLFGIDSTGTHSCTMPDGNRYLIRKIPTTTDRDIYDGFPLLEWHFQDKTFIDEIKKHLAFRELLGVVTPTGNIANIYSYGTVFVISGRDEKTIDQRPQATVISDTIRERWFIDPEEDKPIANFALSMFRINKSSFETSTVSHVLSALESKIEQVINRVDREQIDLFNVFKDRIHNMILSVAFE
jgi:hypothetical protein